MQVIKPITFVSATHLVSSNVVEAYPAYNAGTTYAKDARVDYGTHIYQSLVNNNIGNLPDAVNSTFWIFVGPDNTHAMFDAESTTQSVTSGALQVVLKTGSIDSLYLGNLTAVTCTLTCRDGSGGTIFYQKTIDLTGVTPTDWFSYFFEDPSFTRTQVVFQDIPTLSNTYAYITVSNGSASTKVGQILFGHMKTLGYSQYGASAGIIDYSRKTTDEFGATTFVRRGYAKKLSANVMIDNLKLNRTQRILYDLTATPAVWIATQDPNLDEAMVVYGFYKDFSTVISYPNNSMCSIEIEGLI
jgi:hypothetical protein